MNAACRRLVQDWWGCGCCFHPFRCSLHRQRAKVSSGLRSTSSALGLALQICCFSYRGGASTVDDVCSALCPVLQLPQPPGRLSARAVDSPFELAARARGSAVLDTVYRRTSLSDQRSLGEPPRYPTTSRSSAHIAADFLVLPALPSHSTANVT